MIGDCDDEDDNGDDDGQGEGTKTTPPLRQTFVSPVVEGQVKQTRK
jgi:hypothetical protein